MSCRKHPSDLSSTVGVCASCLRERLHAAIAAELINQAQEVPHRSSDANSDPTPRSFSQSASPYNASQRNSIARSQRRLYIERDEFIAEDKAKRRKGGRLASLISGVFRSKSGKPFSANNSDPNSVGSDSDSPSWFSVIRLRRKKNRTFSVDGRKRKAYSGLDDGVLPGRHSDEVYVPGDDGSSSESTKYLQGRMKSPASMRRSGTKKALTRRAKSASSTMAFCLTPLICAKTETGKERRRNSCCRRIHHSPQ